MKTFLSKTWRFTKKFLLWYFILSFVYLLVCKWLMPPITLTQLTSFVSGDGLKRDYVSMNEIAAHVKLAAIAAEDQAFPDHWGFDIESIRKSFAAHPKKKKKLPAGAGTSTISQQTAKNVFLFQGGGPLKYVRKVPEAYFTLLQEGIWGKKRILEVYLNIAEMGKGIYGIEAAAQAYFSKSAKNLTRQEAAQIIACLPNPKVFTVKPLSAHVAWKSQWIMKQMNNLEDDDDIQALLKVDTR
jgi:monofunctional glycosyltransferase